MRRAALIGVAIAVFVAPTAHASDGTWERGWGKGVVNGGGSGAEICTVAAACTPGVAGGLGGEIDEPRGIATDAAGNVYVAETTNNRVSRFDPQGNFQRAWGKDVVTGGGTGFEICTVAANCKPGLAGGLGGELNSPAGVATGSSGVVYVAEFNGQRISRFDSLGNFQRAWGKDVVGGGGTGFEICTVAADCQTGTGGGLGGEFSNPNGVAADALGNVYVADMFNHRVQQFLAAGSVFQRAWGRDVVVGGSTGYEICTVAANCKGGVAGGLGGEMSEAAGVASDGSIVYVADAANNRIQGFDSIGNFQRAWGKDVVAAGGTGFEICTLAANCQAGQLGGLGGEFNGPAQLAANSSSVYVVDGNPRVQSFDLAGNFERAWGRDVVAGGATGFEVCTAAASCAAGQSGGLGGELDSPGAVGTGPEGLVYTGDIANQRIEKFGNAPPPPPPPPPPPDGDGDPPPPEPPAADTEPPNTTITERPKNKTKSKKAEFEYESSEPGSTFEYSLDGKAFKPVGDAKTLKVKVGKHVFEVRAIDPAGNVDSTPARDRWTRKPKPGGGK